MAKGFVIAIDGPAGAGKSTVSRCLAEALPGKLLDTGVTYRSVAYLAIQGRATDEEQFQKIASQLEFAWDETGLKLLTNGKDLGVEIRTEEISQMASHVSRFPSVRKILTEKQRNLGIRGSAESVVVAEGRDIGTVVFPDTPHKFYVTADAPVRAERRYQQLKEMGEKNITLEEVLKQQLERDKQDSTRKAAPLQCAKDATVVDTSNLSIEAVVRFIVNHVKK